MPVAKPLFNPRVVAQEVGRLRRTLTAPSRGFQLIRDWAQRISEGSLNSYSESQVEQAFNAAMFVDVLEYRPLGSGTAHIVPKRTGATGRDTPDVVLGVFNPPSGVERWHAVCEIKGLHTDLDLPQTSRYVRETPVQQAFRYALTGRPGVEWVIVTNFREIRLYRNGYVGAYQRWLLSELADYERFFEFWALLRQPHLAPETGRSETLRILNASIDAGLALTEGFYGVYDLARQLLGTHLKNAPRCRALSATEVLGKTHKLLNRVLFSAFCEDHPAQLLPHETLKKLHRTAAQDGREGSYWRTFQKFFTALDKGSPPGSPDGFNAFNGGLFAPDAILDDVRLPNELFTTPLAYRRTRRESRQIEGVFGFYVYDFSSELDVDSLGAIFEQSLKDLPHAAASVRGHGEISITRRENKGVYYTSPAITGYLVGRALEAYLTPLRDSVLAEVAATPIPGRKGKRSLSVEERRDVLFLQKMMDRLRDLSLVDPACGSGAFLIAAFEYLHDEYERTNAALAQLKGARPMFGLDRIILRDNLHGVDVLAESVEITKLSLWLRTATRDEPLEKLDNNIRCADTLAAEIDDRFDIAVSNPPWGADLDGWTDEEILRRFPSVGSEKDSAALFVLRTFELLKPGGILAFILPNSWITVDGYEPFRKWLLTNAHVLELTHVWKIFEDVNHDACLLMLRRPHPDSERPATTVRALARGASEATKNQHLAEERFAWEFAVDSTTWLDEPATRFETVYPPDIAKELSRVAGRCTPLGDRFDVTVGIQVYHQRNVPKHIIETKAFHADRRKGDNWFPYITGNDVQRYFTVFHEDAFLFYNERLCDKRELAHYAEPRIVVQQIFWNRLSASLEVPREPSLYLNTLFSISRPRTVLDLAGLLAILNSRVMSATYERWANRLFGDKFPKVSKLDLARLPIPAVTKPKAKKLSEWGGELQERWSRLKTLTMEFQHTAALADSSGRLGAALTRFWEVQKPEVVDVIGSTLETKSLTEKETVFDRWAHARRAADTEWSAIARVEMQVEEMVAELYGLKRDVYDRVIARAPVPSMNDILLPR